MTQIMTQTFENAVFPRGLRSTEYGSSPVSRTTIRPKTQFSDGYFMHNMQKQAIIQPKIAKKGGGSPQIFAIFLILGIAILR